ncbi:MAG: hypothetical protein K0Q95_1728 [Bacteroidota bacterium]|nr:hypothetical protein [Bacteroidota bacterium]
MCALSQNWTGNINSDWNNQGNWSSWPLSGEDLLIDTLNYTGAKASPIISSASVFSPAEVVIQNGAVVSINNNLNASGRIELIGEGTKIIQNAGTVQASGSGSSGRFIVSEGAQVNLNGGNIFCQQRLIVELGASIIMNGGNVNVIEEIAVGDGDLSGSSLFLMKGGSIVTGGLGFENEFGVYEPTFKMASGSLTVNGNVSWLGVLPGQGTPRLILQGGTAVINGSLLNETGSTVNLYAKVSDTANVTFNGPSIALVNATDSVVHRDASTLTINNSNTFSNAGVWYGDNSLITFNGNTILSGTGAYQFNSLLIVNGKFLSQVIPDIKVSGDITNNGTINTNTGLIELNGGILQTVSGANTINFYDVRINNSSTGISLAKSTVVNHELELNRGLINTDVVNHVIIADNAIVSTFSDSSFVNGPMVKKGNDAFVFPVGKVNKLSEIAIGAPFNVNAEFVAEYFNDGFSDTLSMNAPLSNVSNHEYWKLQQTSGLDSVTVGLFWNDSAFSIESCNDLTIAKWDGSAWNNVPAGLNGACNSGNLTSQQAQLPNGFLTIGNVSLITSVMDNHAGEEVIYPNPMVSLSSLTIKSKTEIKNVEIFDVQGRMIHFIKTKGSREVTIPNTNLSPGLYFVNIFSEKEKVSKKLIVH